MTTGIRRQARILALQTLFECSLAHHVLAEVLQRHVYERGISAKIAAFATKILLNISENSERIDSIILSIAVDKPFQQMANIDKSILRIAVCEMLYDLSVPPKVVINEAVEIAKQFGGENSGKLINGVLGVVFTQVGETSCHPDLVEKEVV